MACLSDHWTLRIDLLGYEDFALKVRQLILDSEPPLCFAIGGRWGAGKTSMLQALWAALGAQPVDDEEMALIGELPSSLKPETEAEKKALKHVWPVWFNPWRYQGEPNPLIPLLHQIREQIRWQVKAKDSLRELSVDAFDVAQKSFGRLMDNAVNILFRKKVVDFGQALTEGMEEVGERRRRDTFAEPIDAQRFFREFERAVEGVVGNDRRGRLVVFIDDLDRCHHQTVFALLESIKLYLSSRRCVFVFGLDRSHVETAVAAAGHYNLEEARQYVEKIFQVPLHLPHPKTGKLEAFVDAQLQSLLASLPGVNGDVETRARAKGLAEFLAPLLPPNPRAIKSTLNTLFVYRRLWGSLDPAEERRLFLAQLFRVFHPDAYELLLQNPEDTHLQLSELFKAGAVDFSNELQSYLHHVTENPIRRSPERRTVDGNDAHQPMDFERFRKVRAGAWQGEALHQFQTRFLQEFPTVDRLRPYLI